MALNPEEIISNFENEKTKFFIIFGEVYYSKFNIFISEVSINMCCDQNFSFGPLNIISKFQASISRTVGE